MAKVKMKATLSVYGPTDYGMGHSFPSTFTKHSRISIGGGWAPMFGLVEQYVRANPKIKPGDEIIIEVRKAPKKASKGKR